MQAGQDVCGFEVREVRQDLGVVNALGKHFEDVRHPDPKPSNTSLPAALTWIEGDALVEIGVHGALVLAGLQLWDPSPGRLAQCL